MKKIAVLSLLATSITFTSCEKEYMCVCKNTKTEEIVVNDKVTTTNLGKKGFEKACKNKSTEQQECYVK